ncbi:Holliday junction resolvase RecU [Metamycoplasma equirhinis]|uniref:Holliday junction resolvase RecU n=1 Tax=Metamycoplasma equirhinis TaxID=92402 RepID=UPI0035931A26
MKNTNNRGMMLESIINKTNIFYLKNKIAMIHKKNLDVSFSKIKIENRKLLLKDAEIKSKSTVDYYGVFQGKFIAFEAKSTEEKNFKLKNIKQHQLEYLSLIESFDGIAFWIIYFKMQNDFLIIKHKNLMKIISENKNTLAYKDAIAHGYSLNLDFPGILDYIKIVSHFF